MIHKKTIFVITLLISFLFNFHSFAQTNTQICGQPTIINLLAGQTNNVGTVTISNDSLRNITVTYKTINGTLITETHLAVAKSLSGIPQTNSGNPKPGLFNYNNTHNPAVNEVVYVIHPSDINYNIGDTLYIAAHAVVQTTSGSSTKTDTAWGQGPGFPGKNWAMYFTYTVQPCQPTTVINSGDFRTQTQGGWGTGCQGNNPGCYRDTHFVTSFPSGLVVGSPSGNNAKFMTSYAIQSFLPQGGSSSVFNSTYLNPTTTSANVLAGQAVTLLLNIQFDLTDPTFGSSSTHLKDLIVNDNTSSCYNMTVQQVLDEVNAVLSGGGTITPSNINTCVTKINENFDNGTTVGTFLRLP